MRRSPALVLASALVASTLFAFTGASALTPVAGIPHPGGDDGNLSTIPTTYAVGDVVELSANFLTDQAGQDVEYFKETPADSGNYEFIGHDDANSYGNAYLKGYQVNATQRVFAKTKVSGKVTEIHTLTPGVQAPVGPNGPIKGTLAETPTTYFAGDTIQLGANFPDGTFPVSFYEEGPSDVWSLLGTVQSNASGNAYYKTYKVTGTKKVFARKANNDRTEVDPIAPSTKVTLDIQRDCTGNDCGPTATADGVLDPALADVPVKLQYLSGSTWTAIGSPVNSGADGKVSIQFPLAGAPQWTTRTYRLLAGSSTSNQIKFMPGPTKLGKNVLRVDVDNGIYPVDKGPEYAAKATLSVDGTKTLDHVVVEEFGVRGSSTVKYTKKPYKLKFLDKPASNADVFGLPRGKSWTLLANYLDQTNIRNKVGLELGRRLKAHGNHLTWTPDSRFVELFVNDQYRGAYQMTESVKIDKDRANVDETTGMIMDVDANKVEDPSIEFLATKSLTAFIFKDPDERNDADPKAVTGAKFNAVKGQINAFENKLYSNTATTRDDYPAFLDKASAIDYYLVKEFTKDNDADFYKSHYFTWDQTIDVTEPLNPLQDGKFHFGPVWDFDRSAGNVDPDTAGHTAVSSPTGWYLRGIGTPSDSGRTRYKTHWFVQLFEDAGFRSAVKARWAEVKAEFAKVHQTETAAYAAELGVGASNDRNRWKNEPKRYQASHGELSYVTDWYEDRYNWINTHIND